MLRYLSFYSVDELTQYRVKGRGLLADVFTRLVDHIYFNFNQNQVRSMAGLLHKVFSLVPVYAINSGATALPIKKVIWLSF